jgi:hypothetical protein
VILDNGDTLHVRSPKSQEEAWRVCVTDAECRENKVVVRKRRLMGNFLSRKLVCNFRLLNETFISCIFLLRC